MDKSYKDIGIETIKEAGLLLSKSSKKVTQISFKQRNDYVTNIDIEIENLIKKRITKSFPNHSIIAEETGIKKEISEYSWYIDPISATSNFIHGLPHFACSLALRKRDKFLFSVVLDPFYDELFFAELGKGAYLNDHKISVSETNKLSKSILFLGIHNRGNISLKSGFEYFKKVFTKISEYRRIGSTALQFCWVACGRADGHLNNHNDIFAVAAGKLTLEEAGGKLTDFEGREWSEKSNSVLATNGKIHQSLVNILKKTN